jgi:hypothetical protein
LLLNNDGLFFCDDDCHFKGKKITSSVGTKLNRKPKAISSHYVLLGVVDHMEGSGAIKLKRDDAGRQQFISLEWVTRMDEQGHLNLSSDQAIAARTAAPREDAALSQTARIPTDEHRLHCG